jgi:multidrug efflux pump subunit AcrA (membrane-fusion protein)
VRIGLLVVLLMVAGAGWWGLRAYRNITATKDVVVPTAKVSRGDITISVTARGELRGGNSEMLFAPMTGGLDMHVTSLMTTGEPVKTGQVVAEFDTTEQEYKLKEAEADLAEAEAHLAQARAQNDAQDEEDRYALLKAESDVRTAELDVRKNPLLPALTARADAGRREGPPDATTAQSGESEGDESGIDRDSGSGAG